MTQDKWETLKEILRGWIRMCHESGKEELEPLSGAYILVLSKMEGLENDFRR